MNNLLEKHAKSFYWASFFLSKKLFQKCSSLYNFCRTLDDLVDDEKTLDLKRIRFLKFLTSSNQLFQQLYRNILIIPFLN